MIQMKNNLKNYMKNFKKVLDIFLLYYIIIMNLKYERQVLNYARNFENDEANYNRK